MSRKALVLLVCCCDFRDGAERLMPSKSPGNAVIRAFPGLFRILRMCAPRRAAAVVRPRGREKSADRRRRILISRLLIIRAAVPRRKSPFPAYFKGFPAISPLIPPYPAFLKYPVSPQPSSPTPAATVKRPALPWMWRRASAFTSKKREAAKHTPLCRFPLTSPTSIKYFNPHQRHPNLQRHQQYTEKRTFFQHFPDNSSQLLDSAFEKEYTKLRKDIETYPIIK